MSAISNSIDQKAALSGSTNAAMVVSALGDIA